MNDKWGPAVQFHRFRLRRCSENLYLVRSVDKVSLSETHVVSVWQDANCTCEEPGCAHVDTIREFVAYEKAVASGMDDGRALNFPSGENARLNAAVSLCRQFMRHERLPTKWGRPKRDPAREALALIVNEILGSSPMRDSADVKLLVDIGLMHSAHSRTSLNQLSIKEDVVRMLERIKSENTPSEGASKAVPRSRIRSRGRVLAQEIIRNLESR